MDAGIEEADSESFEIVTAGQIVDLASGFHGESQAFEAGKEKLDAEAAEDFEARLAIARDQATASHEVKVQVRFVKDVLEEFQSDDVVRGACRINTHHAFDINIAGDTVLQADAGHAIGLRVIGEFRVVAQTQASSQVSCFRMGRKTQRQAPSRDDPKRKRARKRRAGLHFLSRSTRGDPLDGIR